ncbi:MAG: hypothetical protein EU541_02410 [Promethearchaeota archaeon]|nr:MAG: hypothetical protein EU541_02410 [Candidatus Lokiarchaeota archaeon]
MKIEISITCPICSKWGKIEIAEKELGKASRGLLSISISEDLICEHSFIAYVDRNLKVRDYFVPDFEISLRGLGSVKNREGMESISSEDDKIETSHELGLPTLPENCGSGDLIEQEYKKKTLLSYLFTIKKSNGKEELFSFSILLNKNQEVDLYKLVIKEFIEFLKQNSLLNEKFFKTNQKLIYKNFNDKTDIETENIFIPLSNIFKSKKKELKKLRMEELKGSFF